MTDCFIYDAIRTPRGKGKKNGSLHEVTSVELATQVLNNIKDRNDLDTSDIDDVVLGCVTPVGEQGADIAFIKNLKIKEELGLPKWTKKPNNMEFRMNNICSISHEKLDENVKQLGCSLCKNVFKLDTLEHWLNINYKIKKQGDT